MVKNGQYYYARHRASWGVWKRVVDGDFETGEFHADFNTKEEARAEVYKLNGWKRTTT